MTMSLAGHVRPQRPSTSLDRHALEALSVPRPSTSAGISAYTADNSFGRAQAQSPLSMRPGTAMSKTKIQNKIVRLEPFVTPPSRSSVRERYVQKGGAPAPDVEVPSSACWCQRQGPHVTTLVLDSPRAPDFNPIGSCTAPVTCASRTCTTCTFSAAEMCP